MKLISPWITFLPALYALHEPKNQTPPECGSVTEFLTKFPKQDSKLFPNVENFPTEHYQVNYKTNNKGWNLANVSCRKPQGQDARDLQAYDYWKNSIKYSERVGVFRCISTKSTGMPWKWQAWPNRLVADCPNPFEDGAWARHVDTLTEIFSKIYVDASSGKDSFDGLTEKNAVKSIRQAFKNIANLPDNQQNFIQILVKKGEYSNWKYGQGWQEGASNPAAVTIKNLNHVKLQNFNENHRPIIPFDGSGGITLTNSTFVEISGFEIYGPNQDITKQQAMDNRLKQDMYFSGRGIAAWSGNNYYFHDNVVHDCPNSGIRINKGDYCRIENNQVYRNTWWSSNAESAIVFADSLSIDQSNEIKMVLKNNTVYENINKIPYYNYHYDDPAYMEANQMHAARENYGTKDQDFIIDGSGVYITRNGNYEFGKFELAYNTAYHNGINGVVVHKTNRALVHHNVIYNNGQVPKTAPESRQNYAGLVLNTAEDVSIYDNYVQTEDADDFGYVLNGANFNSEESINNLSCLGRVNGKFTDANVEILPAGCEEKYN